MHQEEYSESDEGGPDSFSEGEEPLEPSGRQYAANRNDASNNFGFSPLASENQEERPNKRKREESEESRRLKTEIQLLLCRHPKLIPRTSHEIMEKLNTLSDEELFNVHLNALNDVAELKDNPSGAAVIMAMTKPVDLAFLPGFTQLCLNDGDLRRNVEAEVTLYLGRVSGLWLVAFQLLNNAYTAFMNNLTLHNASLPLTNETPLAKFAREEEEREKKRRASGEDTPVITPLINNAATEKTNDRSEDASHKNDGATLQFSEHATSLKR